MSINARTIRWIILGAGLALGASLADAQPAQRRAMEPGHAGAPGEPGQPGGRIEEFDPAIMRERLERRLAELEAEVQRLHEAMGALNDGAPPQDVFMKMREPREGRAGGGVGGGGELHERRPMGEMRERHAMGELRERRPGHEFRPMTDEERASLLEFVRVNMPRVADRLEALQADHPELADRMLNGLRDRIAEFRRIAAEHPEDLEMRLSAFRTDMELRHTAMDFVEASHAGDQTAIDAARASLESLVAERVEISLHERERELAMLGERVERLSAELAEARANPQEIVARRLDELLTRLENAPPPPAEGSLKRRRAAEPE